MFSDSNQLEATKEIIPGNQQLMMDAPGSPQVPTGAPVSLNRLNDSLDIEWTDERRQESESPRIENIFDRIMSQSQQDVRVNSASTRAHTNLGTALLNRGRLEEAAIEFETALVNDPDNFLARASVARIRATQGNFAEAQALYESLQRAHPTSTLPLLSLGYISMRRRDFAQAIQLLKQAIKLDEKDAAVRYQIAVAYLGSGNPREAIRHLRVASRSDVLSPSVHQSLGVAYAVAGDTARAIRSFRTALALAPDSREAVHALSKLLLQINEPEQVIELLSNYIERAPDDFEARHLYGRALLESGNYSQARGQLTEALKLVGDNKGLEAVELQNNIGVCYARQGNPDEAANWYRRAINSDPSRITTPYHNLAKLRMLDGDFEGAQEILNACLVYFPGNLDTYVVIAFNYRKNRMADEAIQLMQSLVDDGKVSADIYAMLGTLLAEERRDYAESVAVLKEGHLRYPNNYLVVNNLAYSLLMAGDVTAAERLLSHLPKGIRLAERRTQVSLIATRGLLRFRKGEIEEGIQLYQEAERLARRFNEADLAQTAKQKMHLELARTYRDTGNPQVALQETRLGLMVQDGSETYGEDLRHLRDQLISETRHTEPTS
jgi:tetratricopeptide (TPR) repeat protein